MRLQSVKFFLSLFLISSQLTGSTDHSIVSIYAVESGTGKVLIDQNSDLSLVPGSCMKVVTTSAALHLLGPETRFETNLEYDGAIAGKTLRGNLYICGGGDPSLGSGRIPGTLSWNEQVDAWATAIEKLGVKKIEGCVVGDASKWEKALAVPSWSWEDLGNYYGAGASALSFHENAYSLFFHPGKQVGDKAAILRADPPHLELIFQNEVTTGPVGSGDRACIYGTEFSHTQFVRGTIPAAVQEFAIKGAIPDPAKYCARLLAIALEKRGITVEKKKLAKSKERTIFHTTYSPTVKEIAYWTNQKSINLYAEHLLKKMGEIHFNEGSTIAGVKAIHTYLLSQKIDVEGFNMVDGSGLSRKNLATTKQLVAILLKVKSSEFFPIILESLPKKEGIRSKSGSMSLMRGYVGYYGDIAFAFLINHSSNEQLMNAKVDSFFSDLKKLDSSN